MKNEILSQRQLNIYIERKPLAIIHPGKPIQSIKKVIKCVSMCDVLCDLCCVSAYVFYFTLLHFYYFTNTAPISVATILCDEETRSVYACVVTVLTRLYFLQY